MPDKRICLIRSCRKNRLVDPKLSMFSLPKDLERRTKWMEILQIDQENVLQNSVVCASHFDRDAFTNEKQLKLKKTALPCHPNEKVERKQLNVPSLCYRPIAPKGKVLITPPSNVHPSAQNQSKSTIVPALSPIQPSVTTPVYVQSPFNYQISPILESPLVMFPSSPFPMNYQNNYETTPTHSTNSQYETRKENRQFSHPIFLISSALFSCPSVSVPAIAVSEPEENRAGSGVTRGRALLRTGNTRSRSRSKTINELKRDKERTRKLKNATERLKRLTKVVKTQKNKLKEKPNKRQQHDDLIEQVLNNNDPMSVIIKSQIKRLSSKTQKWYTSDEKSIAMTIYFSCGSKGYQSLKKMGFKLPTIRCINLWLSKFKINPGCCEVILNFIKKEVANMTEKDKDCVFVWDEMGIKKFLTYDKYNDRLEGIQDHGDGRRQLKIANYALATMVRGIHSN